LENSGEVVASDSSRINDEDLDEDLLDTFILPPAFRPRDLIGGKNANATEEVLYRCCLQELNCLSSGDSNSNDKSITMKSIGRRHIAVLLFL